MPPVRYGRKNPEFEQAPVPAELPGTRVEELDSVSRDVSSGTRITRSAISVRTRPANLTVGRVF